MKIIKKYCFALLSTLLAFSASAQLSIDEAQLLARNNYPLIKQYKLIEQTELFTMSNIAKGWLPQITVSAQATYQNDVMTLPEGLAGMMAQQGQSPLGIRKDQYKASLSVVQPVYDGGAISAQREVVRQQTAVESSKNDVELYALRERVNGLFFSLLLVNERLASNEALIVLLQSNEEKLSALLNGGMALQADVDAVKAERLTAMGQKASLEASLEALQKMLSAFVGKRVEEVERPSEPRLAESGIRPELQLFNRQLGVLDAQERALNSALMPKFNVFAQGYYGYPGFNAFHDMFSHQWSFNAMIGAQLTWNIGALYTRKNDKQKIQTSREQVGNAREVFLFNTKLLSDNEGALIGGYRKMLVDDTEIIKLRENVRRSSEAKLAQGIVDVNTLLAEITRENQARISKSTHEIELLQHLYNQLTINNHQ